MKSTKSKAQLRIKRNGTKPDRESLLTVLAFILPTIIWLIARLFNPSGWMSNNFMVVYGSFIFYLPLTLMFVVPILCIVLISRLYGRNISITKLLQRIIILVSVLYSAWMFFATITASSEEPE